MRNIGMEFLVGILFEESAEKWCRLKYFNVTQSWLDHIN